MLFRKNDALLLQRIAATGRQSEGRELERPASQVRSDNKVVGPCPALVEKQ